VSRADGSRSATTLTLRHKDHQDHEDHNQLVVVFVFFVVFVPEREPWVVAAPGLKTD